MACHISCHSPTVTVFISQPHALALLILVLGILPLGRTTNAQEESSISLNIVAMEDYREFKRLTDVAQLIKPYCSTILKDELTFPTIPVQIGFIAGQKQLWLDALQQPETELQLQAVQAIARAHSEGVPNFEDTAPVLVKLLDRDDVQPVVKLAAAQALIVLDNRASATVLSRHAADSLDFARLIEPVLAEWDDRSLQSVWLSRLKDRNATPGLMTFAIQAVPKTHLVEAIPHLREIVSDRQISPHHRLEAAKSLGAMAYDNAVVDARGLLSSAEPSGSLLEHLLSAQLLVRQSGSDAEELLLQLAIDAQPATAAIAFRRLLELDPKLTRSAIDNAIQSSDPNLRTLAGQALFQLKTVSDVVRLSELLSDEHTSVRSRAQQWLIESDEIAELSDAVRQSALRVLNSEQPRGIAQAAIVLGTVKHKPAADRLVSLLGREEGDVSIASAWALRKLALHSTADAVYEHMRLEVEDSLIERLYPSSGGEPLEWRWDMYEQHKHLIELLGILEYLPAEPLLRQYVPVSPLPPPDHKFAWIHCTHRSELRSRAIFALGKIHHGRPPRDLVQLLIERMEDMEEVSHVAAMSAVSLGRMKAVDAQAVLQDFYQPDARYTSSAGPESVRALASRRALELLTGETLPELTVEPFLTYRSDWFLEPLDVKRKP
jgi:HEAT repeat protein